MSETTQHISRVVIKAGIQQVWEALTKQGEVLPHFFGSVMHTTGLQPGAQLRMRSPDGAFTGVVGEILECDPPYRFSHTFRFTNFDEAPCRVTYELKEVEGGTEFTLISDRIPAGTKTEKQMIQGGPFITDVLKSVVETGRPSFGKRLLLRVIGMMSFMTPAKCRSENWPLDRAV
ncbi:MAG: SRPBCC domain-containing protein [Planctomycetaceae bacterium]|nr:SRPBCC domain-containing protein [Planctomycetaceae bacterium]